MKLVLFLTCVLVVLLSGVGAAQVASPAPADKQIKVWVIGHVGHIGVYLLPTSATLLDVIAAAGGLQNDVESVSLRRRDAKGDDRPFGKFKVKDVRDGTENPTLKDHDIVRAEPHPRITTW